MNIDYRAELQRLVKAYDDHGGNWPEDDIEAFRQAVERARALLDQPEPEGPALEPRGCPTPGACSCPTSPTVPPELTRALNGDKEAARQFLYEAGFTDKEGNLRPPYRSEEP